MSRIVLKDGVELNNLKPELVLAITIAHSVWTQATFFNKPAFVVTSISEGTHGKKSLHRYGFAFDLRSNNIEQPAQKQEFLDVLKDSLGKDFDCILEGIGEDWEHFHIEYDPE